MERIRVTGLGGVNLFSDPAEVRDDQVTYAKNIIPVKPGRLGKRPALGFHLNSVLFNGRPTAVAVPPFPSADLVVAVRLVDDAGDQLVIGQSGDDSYASIEELNGETLGLKPWLLTVDRRVLVFPSEDTGKVWQVAEVDGAPVISRFVFAGTGNEALQPRHACMYRRRMVYLNFGSGMENTILFSDPDAPETVGDDGLTSRAFTVDADGGEIIGAAEIMLTAVGSPLKSALLVLCRYRAFIITGEAGLSTDTDNVAGDMEVNKTSYACGCASPYTIARTKYGVAWADTEDVWLFPPGQTPVSVGMNIQPVLKNTPEDHLYKWHAAYFNGFYRLALMSEGQGPSQDSGCGEQWWLDLRERPPRNSNEAKWWGPQVFNIVSTIDTEEATHETRNMFVDTRVGKPPALYGLELGGGQDGIPEYVTVAYDTPEYGRDVTVDGVYTQDEIYGTEYTAELHTKEYQIDDGLGAFVYEGAEIAGSVSRDTEMLVNAIVDGKLASESSWSLEAFGFTTDVSALDSDEVADQLTTYSSQVLVPPDPENRPNGARVQLRISDVASFAVSGETFYWGYNGEGYSATFDADAYFSNIYIFAEYLVQLMNDTMGLGDVFTHNVSITPPRASALVSITADALWSYGYGAGADSRVWALLGFKVAYLDGDALPGTALTHTALEAVYWKPSTSLELRGIRVLITPYNRRPEP